MGAIDVCVHRRESVGKALGDKTLGGKMVALIELIPADDMKDGWVTLQASGVKLNAIQQVLDATKASLRILQRNASY